MENIIRFALAAFAGLALAACSDDADNYKVYLDRTEVETGAPAGTFTVRVHSNFPWKAEVADASFNGWCTLSGAEGNAGEGEFAIEVGENETGGARVAQVVVTAGGDRATVSVVQGVSSGTKLDRVMRSDYLGDEFANGLGYLSFELRGGELSRNGKPEGAACVLSVGCFTEMAADPERAALPGGEYESVVSPSEGREFTFLADGEATFLDVYDESAVRTRFAMAPGSRFTVSHGTNGTYSIFGTFVDGGGRTAQWHFEGYMKFRNPKGLDTDKDGYRILRSDGCTEARYEGNIDGYGTAKLVFDVRDPFRGDGMNIAVYVPLHPEFDYPGGASLALGSYSFGTAGDPMTLEAGYVENTLPYGSYTYQISGGVKYITRMIVGGGFTVGRYDTEEYDIRFDLTGEDGTGTPPASIGKYRYIGPITFADKRPETYTINPVNVVAASYAGVSPDGKTGKYIVRFGTSDTEWDRSSQHLVLTFYGDIPASGAAPRLKPGTYTCSRETYEALTFEQGYLPLFNPSGTYYMDVDASGLRTAYLVDKGRFTVSETAAGYRFDIDLGAYPNGETDRVIIRLGWEGELSFE